MKPIKEPSRPRGRPRNEEIHALAAKTGKPPRAVANDKNAVVARTAFGAEAEDMPIKVLVELGALLVSNGWDSTWARPLPQTARKLLLDMDAAGLFSNTKHDLERHFGADVVAQKLRQVRVGAFGLSARGVDVERALIRAFNAIRREAALCGIKTEEFFTALADALKAEGEAKKAKKTSGSRNKK